MTDTADNGVSSRAQALSSRINKGVDAIFKSANVSWPDDLAPANPQVFQRIFEGVFFSGAKSKFFLLNEEESMNQHVEKDVLKFIRRRFGPVFDFARALEVLGESDKVKGERADLEELKSRAFAAIKDDLKYYNQRERVEWRVDMFTSDSRIELREDVARVVVTHRPSEVGTYDSAVIDDFREHFPEFDDFLHWLAASRFAVDRKLAYLWMLLPSDFGKGLLMGQLKALGAVVEMSVKEIESAFEGKPLARSPEDFRRAILLWVDEFKTVKSELKQLQSEMSIAPKFQLTASVQIYAKVFTSAESVASLVSEHGVEDQFANRMSILTGSGTVSERPAFQKNQVEYTRSLKHYIAETLNSHIESFVSLGADDAALKAVEVLKDFAEKHGLGKYAGRISEAIPELAEDFRGYALAALGGHIITRETDGTKFLKSPTTHIDTWLLGRTTKSEYYTLRRRVPDIIAALSVDGNGVHTYAKGSERIKGVKIA